MRLLKPSLTISGEGRLGRQDPRRCTRSSTRGRRDRSHTVGLIATHSALIRHNTVQHHCTVGLLEPGSRMLVARCCAAGTVLMTKNLQRNVPVPGPGAGRGAAALREHQVAARAGAEGPSSGLAGRPGRGAVAIGLSSGFNPPMLALRSGIRPLRGCGRSHLARSPRLCPTRCRSPNPQPPPPPPNLPQSSPWPCC